jgi:hypothetical protein
MNLPVIVIELVILCVAFLVLVIGLLCGGILTSIWMWSAHASASMISTFFSSHSFRSIRPMSALSSP